MLNKTITKALQSVEWNAPETHITKKGKTRTIQTGIPQRLFWGAYKRNRATFQKLGITLKIEGKHFTGDYKRKKPIYKKVWTVIAWHPDRLQTILYSQPLNQSI